MSDRVKSRFSSVRDWTLLGVGVIMLLSGTVGALQGKQAALALIGAGLTACGLVPTLARDKEADRRD